MYVKLDKLGRSNVHIGTSTLVSQLSYTCLSGNTLLYLLAHLADYLPTCQILYLLREKTPRWSNARIIGTVLAGCPSWLKWYLRDNPSY